LSLRPVSPAQVWHEAGPLIARALRGSDSSADEVLAQCRAGRALLLAAERGYVVLNVEPCDQGFDLVIWVAVSRGARDCIAAHLEQLESLARALGARRLAFRTGRRGFARRLPADWKVHQVIWAKEI